MISFENTLPVKIDSKKYNDFELLKNDVNELVLKDYNGFPASDPILFFRQIVEQMVEDVEKSDEKRIYETYYKHQDHSLITESLCDALRKMDPIPISKAIKTCGIQLHPNKLCVQIKHLPVLM